ncbi:sigma-54-dependent transcriptional regulator [Qipengyuania huizhouensis]|uniref:sigma-54-dependent transcriptional regulator n=1 Tax=Qipengyuania huizhouensis TaxID=2867245 RepID=UPI001C87155C|nr:sigma-54 dependent transcriptional regulator [Qipengyuania huizhouensis]MBX7460534.1 sigma-54 dependent transcriptional regulator [Qipengyuania huizhouensis]
MSRKVLLVEDDRAIATVITEALRDEGFDLTACTSVAERDALLAKESYDVMLTDIMLEDGDGLDTIDRVHKCAPDMPIIVLSAQNTLDTAIRASDSQAFEYFPKPFDLDQLTHAVRQAAERIPRTEVEERNDVGSELPLIGRSRAMQDVYRMITRVLRNDLTVLVTGESGTGKELVAEAIHQLGSRRTGPFVAVNMAAIPRDLLESELFGHERGAFTGAQSQSIGKFEQANGGTLFLDEIGDMPAEAQTRLLRALQSGRIRRVGGRQEIAVEVRIVAATNRDLAPMIASGLFREDLFYRLNVVPIHLPPLRERTDDIGALTRHFLAEARDEGLSLHTISDDAISRLSECEWRGNVRELRNFVFRMALMARNDVIEASLVDELLPPKTLANAGNTQIALEIALAEWLEREKPIEGTVYQQTLAAFEKPLIEHALRETHGNQLRAAQFLGINRNTLRKKLGELDIRPQRFAQRT